MRIISTCVLFLLIPAGSAQAQSSAELMIRLGVYELNQDGGDRALGMWRRMGPVVIGRSVSGTFSFGDTCEAWAVSSTKGDIRDDTTTAWLIEVTPVRVVRDAVTFRMRWVRATGLKQQLDDISFDGGKAARAPSEDIELTLRPGESWPVDSVRVPSGAKTVHGRPCGSSASIRVSVEHYPSEGDERRLVLPTSGLSNASRTALRHSGASLSLSGVCQIAPSPSISTASSMETSRSISTAYSPRGSRSMPWQFLSRRVADGLRARHVSAARNNRSHQTSR